MELRGTDASGIWAAERGASGGILYHKQPIKSSLFVKTEYWDGVEQYDPAVMLVHARATSKTSGHASINRNNHPFVSDNLQTGLVHNGVIYESEYLKKKYEIRSDTDSEYLLRIYEDGVKNPKKCSLTDLPTFLHTRIMAIAEIWSIILNGHMAVAIGEQLEDLLHTQCLFLFRNDKRPLWIADLRTQLGQVFFFSSLEIWNKAIKDTPSLAQAPIKLMEIPDGQIWVFTIDDKHPNVGTENFWKINVTTKNVFHEWVAGDFIKISGSSPKHPIISNLDKEDKIIYKPKPLPDREMVEREWESTDGLESWDMMDEEIRQEGKMVVELVEELLEQIDRMITHYPPVDHESLTEAYETLARCRLDLEGAVRICGN